MTQAPGTGGAGSTNPQQAIDNYYRQQGLFSDIYNEANTSPEVQAAYAAGASPQASASELSAFNLGVPDLNNDGRLSNEEFTSWDGYEAWDAANGGQGFLLSAPGFEGGVSGSRFTGEYNADGTPIYVQTGGAAGGTAGGAAGYPTFVPAGQQGAMDYALTLSDTEKLMQDNNLTRAEAMFALSAVNPYQTGVDAEGNVTPSREQAVFNRMMTAMAPQQERERIALETVCKDKDV